MEQNSIILYALIVLVLVGIPVVLSRKTGKNPMELLFGKRRNHGAFGSQKKGASDGTAGNNPPKTGKQTNSNRNDFMDYDTALSIFQWIVEERYLEQDAADAA
jgi:hypothetical protein